MSLFHFGKKKEEKKKSCCCIEKNCTSAPVTPSTNGKITSIQVLGAGCKSCHEQYENATAAVKAMGLDMEVEYITDMEKIMEYGVMSMPAIAVNDKYRRRPISQSKQTSGPRYCVKISQTDANLPSE